jgi:hypothetical protein
MSCEHPRGAVGNPASPDSCHCRPRPVSAQEALERTLRGLEDPWHMPNYIRLDLALEAVKAYSATLPSVTFRGYETRNG